MTFEPEQYDRETLYTWGFEYISRCHSKTEGKYFGYYHDLYWDNLVDGLVSAVKNYDPARERTFRKYLVTQCIRAKVNTYTAMTTGLRDYHRESPWPTNSDGEQIDFPDRERDCPAEAADFYQWALRSVPKEAAKAIANWAADSRPDGLGERPNAGGWQRVWVREGLKTLRRRLEKKGELA